MGVRPTVHPFSILFHASWRRGDDEARDTVKRSPACQEANTQHLSVFLYIWIKNDVTSVIISFPRGVSVDLESIPFITCCSSHTLS